MLGGCTWATVPREPLPSSTAASKLAVGGDQGREQVVGRRGRILVSATHAEILSPFPGLDLLSGVSLEVHHQKAGGLRRFIGDQAAYRKVNLKKYFTYLSWTVWLPTSPQHVACIPLVHLDTVGWDGPLICILVNKVN